jgi:hypothetical protein
MCSLDTSPGDTQRSVLEVREPTIMYCLPAFVWYRGESSHERYCES